MILCQSLSLSSCLAPFWVLPLPLYCLCISSDLTLSDVLLSYEVHPFWSSAAITITSVRYAYANRRLLDLKTYNFCRHRCIFRYFSLHDQITDTVRPVAHSANSKRENIRKENQSFVTVRCEDEEVYLKFARNLLSPDRILSGLALSSSSRVLPPHVSIKYPSFGI